jgi:D-alanyl-D-alanine dipeptidase
VKHWICLPLCAFAAALTASCQKKIERIDDAAVQASSTGGNHVLGNRPSGESVCVHRFGPSGYAVSKWNGSSCESQQQTLPASEVSISGESYKPWLQEISAGGMIKFDIRYFTDKIFPRGDGTYRITHPLYGKARCLLHPNAASALYRAEKRLRAMRPELRLYVFDCYRPRSVSEQMWNLIRDPRFVAASGRSLHNKGAAVDLSLAKLQGTTPVPLDMGSEFDLFDAEKSRYPGAVNQTQRGHRQILRDVMTHPSVGFQAYDEEWWHFSMTGHNDFLNVPL